MAERMNITTVNDVLREVSPEDPAALRRAGLKMRDGSIPQAPSIPERVTAVQARLQALLDDVKIMGIQLGAWERAMTAADVRPKTSAAWRPPADADDAETALLATIAKLEKGTY
jgi:hypothetical protein